MSILYVTELINSRSLCDLILPSGLITCLFIPYYLSRRTDMPGQAYSRPCLHNESCARMQMLRPMLQRARGVLFNSNVENRLADA